MTHPTTPPTDTTPDRGWSIGRIAAWSAAALLFLIPLIGTMVSDEVDWSVGDFVFVAALLLGVGLPLDLVMRMTGNVAYRLAAALALGTAFLLIVVNGAVGIVGSEANDVNALFYAVLGIGIVGSLVARFRPLGMARAMAATAVAQAAVAVGALVTGAASLQTGAFEIIALWVFVALWAGAAVLFREAARRPAV